MNPDINALRERLQAERSQLAETETIRRDAADAADPDQDGVGRTSRADALQDQAMARATQLRAEQRIQRIDAALARIETGTYGECARCGEPIDPRRLDADPAVPLCLVCAEKTGATAG